MSLSDAASLITVADFAQKLWARFRRKKKQTKRRNKTRTKPKALTPPNPTKEEQLAQKLLTDPVEAVREMGAEYIAKNRDRILRNFEDYLVDLFTD